MAQTPVEERRTGGCFDRDPAIRLVAYRDSDQAAQFGKRRRPLIGSAGRAAALPDLLRYGSIQIIDLRQQPVDPVDRGADFGFDIAAQIRDVAIELLHRRNRVLHVAGKRCDGLGRSRRSGQRDCGCRNRIELCGQARRIARLAQQGLEPIEIRGRHIRPTEVPATLINRGFEKAIGDPLRLANDDAVDPAGIDAGRQCNLFARIARHADIGDVVGHRPQPGLRCRKPGRRRSQNFAKRHDRPPLSSDQRFRSLTSRNISSAVVMILDAAL
ncbi:hypothetical protein D9M73_135700 [compost metagenome]